MFTRKDASVATRPLAMYPNFATYKYHITNLNTVINVHDFQLRDHFLNSRNLYVNGCACNTHKHNKRSCVLADDAVCAKCGNANRLFVSFQSLLAHGSELMHRQLHSCCKHLHKPPCGRCLNCQLLPPSKCIITDTFECDLLTGMYYVCGRVHLLYTYTPHFMPTICTCAKYIYTYMYVLQKWYVQSIRKRLRARCIGRTL